MLIFLFIFVVILVLVVGGTLAWITMRTGEGEDYIEKFHHGSDKDVTIILLMVSMIQTGPLHFIDISA